MESNTPVKQVSAGALAARKVTFGPLSRYAIAPVHSRFGGVHWFVWDAESDAEEPAIIRQGETADDALRGLPEPTAQQREKIARQVKLAMLAAWQYDAVHAPRDDAEGGAR